MSTNCRFSLLNVLLIASLACSSAHAQNTVGQLIVHVDQGTTQINRHIYGHFAEHLGRCIYDGFWVGDSTSIENTNGVRADIITALKELAIPNLRWPGGCFADIYHWRDGIGPKDKRPERINVSWGNVPESNQFGTHEFLNLCELLGCEPVICGNVGSGTVRELAEWVEYVNADRGTLADERRANGRDKPWHVRFWGIGNESWGCGGNMRPEYYADVMLRYATFVKRFANTDVSRIAGGASDGDTNWTDVLMQAYRRKPIYHGLSLHHYTLPTSNWDHKGSATDFDEDQWAATMKNTLRMEELVTRHSEIMDKYDPDKKVNLVVDEWGTWYDAEKDSSALYQQNTLRDALVAGINLNIFNNHCQRVRMANIAQTVNVLQSMILTRGKKIVLTPSYFVFRMYRSHQDATMLPVGLVSPMYISGQINIPALTASASRDKNGVIHISLTNLDPQHDIKVACQLEGSGQQADQWKVSGEVLTADRMSAHNDFDKEPEVQPAEFHGARVTDGALSIQLPAKSVIMLSIENAGKP